MASIKVAINGFGRIGRILFRFLEDQPGVGEQNMHASLFVYCIRMQASTCAVIGCRKVMLLHRVLVRRHFWFRLYFALRFWQRTVLFRCPAFVVVRNRAAHFLSAIIMFY
jgi:hypothetical protein